MDEREIDQIKERCARATPGKWIPYVEGRDFTSGSSFIMTIEGDQRGSDLEMIGATDADIDFIAHAKQDIPRLIEEVLQLRIKLKELTK